MDNFEEIIMRIFGVLLCILLGCATVLIGYVVVLVILGRL